MTQSFWKIVSLFLIKTKYILTIWPSNYILGRLSQENEDFCPHSSLCTIDYSSLIWNSQTLRTTQVPLNRWMVKQTGAHAPQEHRSAAAKKAQSVATAINWTGLRGFMLSEKSQPQKVTYFIILFI